MGARCAPRSSPAIGVGSGDRIADTMKLVGKRGRLVVTNIHPMFETDGEPRLPT